MVFGIIVLVVLVIYLLVHTLVFKEYSEVMANFDTLVKVIETRDLLLMRVLPEIKNKRIKEDMTKFISARMNAKKTGNDDLVKADVDINKRLKPIYDELSKSQNPIVKEEFKKIVNLEKKLKTIRREYSESVDRYNEKLSKKPKLYIQKLHMKPLNTYKFS